MLHFKEYFERLTDYTINFEHSTESKQILEMFMSPSKADQRKLYLTKIMSKRSNNDHSEVYAPGSQTIGFKTFIDKGLTTYSTASNIRNIPSFIDGFKSQQRRVCLTKNLQPKKLIFPDFFCWIKIRQT